MIPFYSKYLIYILALRAFCTCQEFAEDVQNGNNLEDPRNEEKTIIDDILSALDIQSYQEEVWKSFSPEEQLAMARLQQPFRLRMIDSHTLIYGMNKHWCEMEKGDLVTMILKEAGKLFYIYDITNDLEVWRIYAPVLSPHLELPFITSICPSMFLFDDPLNVRGQSNAILRSKKDLPNSGAAGVIPHASLKVNKNDLSKSSMVDNSSALMNPDKILTNLAKKYMNPKKKYSKDEIFSGILPDLKSFMDIMVSWDNILPFRAVLSLLTSNSVEEMKAKGEAYYDLFEKLKRVKAKADLHMKNIQQNKEAANLFSLNNVIGFVHNVLFHILDPLASNKPQVGNQKTIGVA